MYFKNRQIAGKKLAANLLQYKDQNAVVSAIPIGGIAVGCAIAESLNAELDISMASIKQVPGRFENVIAAYDDEIEIVIDKSHYFDNLKQEILRSQNDLRSFYRQLRDLDDHPQLTDRIVIITDDGPMTDNKILAAINLARRRRAKKIIVAIPVIAPYLLKKINSAADEFIYLDAPKDFYYINNYYQENKIPAQEEIKKFLQKKCEGF